MTPFITPAIEIKSIDSAGRFAGYASRFGVVDNQRDVVEAGAFASAMAAEVKLLWQHRMDEPIGRLIELFEDTSGLYVEGQLMLSLQRGREAYDLVQSGALKGLSIGYKPLEYFMDAETGIRHLQAVELFEVSLVTFPANEAAEITVVKSMIPSQMVGLSDALGRVISVIT